MQDHHWRHGGVRRLQGSTGSTTKLTLSRRRSRIDPAVFKESVFHRGGGTQPPASQEGLNLFVATPQRRWPPFSCTTGLPRFPSSAAAIRPPIVSDARRRGSASRCA